MKYFLLQTDSEFTTAPIVQNWREKFDVRYLFSGESNKLPERELFFIESNPYTFFTDIILFPFILVSQKVKAIISLYDQSITYKQIILLDSENAKMQLYFCPIVKLIDCLSIDSELNMDKSIIKHAVLNNEKLQDYSFFAIKGVKKLYYVIRLDLAESILRRGAQGIGLLPIEIQKKEVFL